MGGSVLINDRKTPQASKSNLFYSTISPSRLNLTSRKIVNLNEGPANLMQQIKVELNMKLFYNAVIFENIQCIS